MDSKAKQNSAITLMALVVTIIIMLVLAAVSINLAVGDHGLLKQTGDAKEKAEDIQIREKLEQVMMGYQSSPYVLEDSGMEQYLLTKQADNSIDNFVTSTDGEKIILEKEGKFYQWKEDDNHKNSYVIGSLEEELETLLKDEVSKFNGTGSIPITIVTEKTINSEQGYTFLNGQTYVVLDKGLSGDDFDFNIPAGNPVVIKIPYDMTIDNTKTPDRSAINLAPGATLDLYVNGTVTVNSSLGQDGEVGNELGAKGGPGGKAGIHVPENATLNLYGTGELIAYGGKAGDGVDSTNIYGGRRRRRWWSWYWWKWWKRR